MVRATILLAMATGLGVTGLAVFARPDPVLVWNRTASAPMGLYFRQDRNKERPLTRGSRVLLVPDSRAGQWIISHGFAGKDWPMLKTVKAVSGDIICRNGLEISVNSKPVATARETTSSGLVLPSWQGCKQLSEDEFFLLNDHPRSLDGRYFATAKTEDIMGIAAPIWTFNVADAR